MDTRPPPTLSPDLSVLTNQLADPPSGSPSGNRTVYCQVLAWSYYYTFAPALRAATQKRGREVNQSLLYAYCDGCDLADVAATIEAAFDIFVSTREWKCGKAWVVNQVHERGDHDRPDDLPLWDLGMNLEIPNPGDEFPGWFDDIEALLAFCGRLYAQTGREMVIGFQGAGCHFAEDIFTVNCERPDARRFASDFGAVLPEEVNRPT